MQKSERVPSINPNETFPNSDVADQKKLHRATAWIAYADTLEKTAFREFMDKRYVPLRTDSTVSRKVYNAAVHLCREWDNKRGDGRHFVSTGFIISRAFMNDTAIYPNCEADLSAPIERMKHENSPTDFAGAARRGMFDSHPNIFSFYESLYEIAAKRFELNSPERSDSFVAGMALPYMLSVAGQLEKQAKEAQFTSMSTTRLDLRKTEFADFFSNKIPLASDDPSLRLNTES